MTEPQTPATSADRPAEARPETPPGTPGGRQAGADGPRRHPHLRSRTDEFIPGLLAGRAPGSHNGLPGPCYDPARAHGGLPDGPAGDCAELADLGQAGLCECGYPPGSASCRATAPGHRP
jgi:hypothetical protein